jgi:hypothetical protein
MNVHTWSCDLLVAPEHATMCLSQLGGGANGHPSFDLWLGLYRGASPMPFINLSRTEQNTIKHKTVQERTRQAKRARVGKKKEGEKK